MIQRLMHWIPSWAVGLSGTLIILLSTVLLSFVVTGLEEQILQAQKEQANLTSTIELKWDNHKLADLRESQADQLMGLAFVATPGNAQNHLIAAATRSMGGAIQAMDLAANNRVSEAEVTPLDYNARKAFVSKLRMESQGVINATAADRLDVKDDLLRMQSRKSRMRLWVVALNILGLAVVMLKDLPVWKTEG